MEIKKPYIIFLGDAKDYKAAKTAFGIKEWRPEWCVGQVCLSGCEVDLQLPYVNLAEPTEAKTFVIGVSPYERTLPESYVHTIKLAISAGLDIVNPLHGALPKEVVDFADKVGVTIHNVRHRSVDYPKGNGFKRSGLRLLTVGMDCASGKKYTALRIFRELSLHLDPTEVDFRSTGQTGFLISESGINNDTIQADFLSGAAEYLTPNAKPSHWDIVEGQGALSHPSFGAGSLSLLHGTQPDVLVMCLEIGRVMYRGVNQPIVDFKGEVDLNLLIASRNNPNVRLGAISIFTRDAEESAVTEFKRMAKKLFPGIPVFDPSVDSIAFKDFIYSLLDMTEVQQPYVVATEEKHDH